MSKNSVLRAFYSVTGTSKTVKRFTLASVKKDTSLWSQERELTLLNIPLNVKSKQTDARIASYNNFVDPKEFSSKELEDIGDFDVGDENPILARGLEGIYHFLKSSYFQDSCSKKF
jgi:hypothetical protein